MTPTDIAKFLINEVAGVVNKRKVPIDFFPPDFLIALLTLRKSGEMTNSQVREAMNKYVDIYG